MSTNSTIALETESGEIHQIYCHWDGYLEHNGKILQDHYTDPGKLRDLIGHGDLTFLDTEVESSTFYARDLDKEFDDVQAQVYENFEDYLNGRSEEFDYCLRRDGVWRVRCYFTEDRMVPLAEATSMQAALEDN